MKKLSKVIAVAILAVTPFAFGASAGAQSCEIENTGPGSNNQCTVTDNYQCTVTNTNTVNISNGNEQVVQSGTVTNTGNTGTGNSTSGTVTNSNGSSFTVVITNPAPGTTGGQTTCVVTAATPVTPVTPETPATQVQPTQGGGAAVLPNTSSDNALPILATVVGSLAVLSALGVGGVALYRHYKSL